MKPREVEAVPSANVQFLSSSGITHGSNSTDVMIMNTPRARLSSRLSAFGLGRDDGRWECDSPKELLDDLIRTHQLLLELLRVDEVLRVARLPGHDGGKLRRRLDLRMRWEILGLRHDLLAFLAQDEVGEQHRRVGMLGALEHRERAGGARH